MQAGGSLPLLIMAIVEVNNSDIAIWQQIRLFLSCIEHGMQLATKGSTTIKILSTAS